MKKLSSLSVFFPTLNDANILPSLITQAYTAARTHSKRHEVIIINDGSTDNTARVLAGLKKRYPRLKVITHKTNKGYGGALISGFAAAKYDWIFYTDGDGQYDPTELSRLVERATSRIDVVNGYKTKRADNLVRKIIGSIYNWTVHIFRSIPIRDIDCDFRLIRKTALQKITLSNTTGAICLELITKLDLAGARFDEVEVSHYPRRFGRSQFFRWNHLLRTTGALLGHT